MLMKARTWAIPPPSSLSQNLVAEDRLKQPPSLFLPLPKKQPTKQTKKKKLGDQTLRANE